MSGNSKYGTLRGSFYEVLNVPANAPFEEIRKQYYAAALQLHPDKQKYSPRMDSIAGETYIREGDNAGSGLRNAEAASTKEQDSIERVDGVEIEVARSRTTDSVSAEVLNAEMTRRRYLRVVEAWDVLRDKLSRDNYDKRIQEELQRAKELNAQITISDDIVLDETEHHSGNDGEGPYYTYPCRCGDVFLLNEYDLHVEDGERRGDNLTLNGIYFGKNKFRIIVPCNSCSLNVQVTVSGQLLHNTS